MKNLLLLAACLAVLICSAGCPSGDGGADSPKASGTATSGNAQTTPGSPDSTSAAETTTVSEGIFEIAGVKLGMAYGVWQELYPESAGVTMDFQWVTEGQTGIASAAPDDMGLAPYDSAWFLESQLVGFYSDLMLTQEEFEARIEALEARAGESVTEPPAWALAAPFFAEYTEPGEGISQHFWLNEGGHEVLMAFHMDVVGQGMFSLINIDLLDGRIEEALDEKMNLGMGSGVDDEMDGQGMVGSSPGAEATTGLVAVPDGKFGFDGVFLGADANMIKGRYESRGLTALGMWIDRDWTGRVDGNPLSEDKYPSETAWFLDGGLVGFMNTVVGSAGEYASTKDYVVAMYGEQLSAMPKWAAESDFITVHTFTGTEDSLAIWVNEANRGLLLIGYEPSDQTILTMLVDVDKYLEAMEATDEMVKTQGHS